MKASVLFPFLLEYSVSCRPYLDLVPLKICLKLSLTGPYGYTHVRAARS